MTRKSYILSTSPVRCSHCALGNPKKSFSAVLFIHTSDYLRYLTRQQSVIHLPTPTESATTLTCELQNFFIQLKVCCVLSDILGSGKSQLWVVISGSEKTPCDVWQLECQASNVTASVHSNHVLHYHMLPIFVNTIQSCSTPHCAEIQPTSQQAAAASLNTSISIHTLLRSVPQTQYY